MNRSVGPDPHERPEAEPADVVASAFPPAPEERRAVYLPPPRTYFGQFALAFRGIAVGVRGQRSFLTHVPIGILVLVVAALLRVARWEWCVLLLCIGVVLAAELFNSSLEILSRAVTRQYDPFVRDALDVAAGTVLLTSLVAAAVGLVIFVPHLAVLILMLVG